MIGELTPHRTWRYLILPVSSDGSSREAVLCRLVDAGQARAYAGLGALGSVDGHLEFQKPLTSAVVEQLRQPLAGADAALAQLEDNR